MVHPLHTGTGGIERERSEHKGGWWRLCTCVCVCVPVPVCIRMCAHVYVFACECACVISHTVQDGGASYNDVRESCSYVCM